MSFKDILKEKLKNKINIELLEFLPSGYQQIGNICVITLNKKLLRYKKTIGNAILKNFPQFRTVLNKKSGIKGQKRLPQVEIIAGNKNTETIHVESGIRYELDPVKVMFSKGNINERHRIAKLIGKNEVVVDMFAGIGYFTIPIAKENKAGMIYAIELNPVSYRYLNENIKINKIQRDKTKTFNDDCRKIIPKLKRDGIRADRILMGLLPSPEKYLKYAKMIAKNGTIIHYEAISENPKKLIREVKKFFPKIKIKKIVKVKSYRPKTWHYTVDIECHLL